VWEKYQEQVAEWNGGAIDADVYIEARARFAICAHQPYFLAQVFIEAANDLKSNRIKLSYESTYVCNVNKYLPNRIDYYSLILKYKK